MGGRLEKVGALVGKTVDDLELVALLAEGGTAEVYLARDHRPGGLDQIVVVKRILPIFASDPYYVDMFLDEARLAGLLDHSNIVQTRRLGNSGEFYYLEMEYLAGLSLAQMAKKLDESKTPMPIDVALCLAAQVCDGLAYAHRKTHADGGALDLVHRDISPQNLIASFNGVAKIVDFGIAKATRRESRTQVGTIKGKFAYMSPEQILGSEVDLRSDIFSLGTVLHELLTSSQLFRRPTTHHTFHLIVNGMAPPPSEGMLGGDEALDDLVLTALAVNADDRYQGADEFARAIRGYMHSKGYSANPSVVARYMGQQFQTEISLHQATMAQLVKGEQTSSLAIRWTPRDSLSETAVPRLSGDQTIVDAPGLGPEIFLQSPDSTQIGTAGPLGFESTTQEMPTEIFHAKPVEAATLEPAGGIALKSDIDASLLASLEDPTVNQRLYARGTSTAPEYAEASTPLAPVPGFEVPAAVQIADAEPKKLPWYAQRSRVFALVFLASAAFVLLGSLLL